MSLFGISIVIASLSIFCYINPPSSWTFLAWLRIGLLKKICDQDATQLAVKELRQKDDASESEKKAEVDRTAMPPPPPVIPKRLAVSSATIFSQNISKGIGPPGLLSSSPTINIPGLGPTSPTASFPAQNSIQRVSGGTGQVAIGSTSSQQQLLRSTGFSLASASRSPAPSRVPLPNPSAAVLGASSLTIPLTRTSIPIKPSKKVLLTPGHSPLDWAVFSNSPHTNLRGLPPSTPYLKVSPSLLRQYTGRKGKDAWTALGGKVYNITPYMSYHPGGEPELMKAAGRDGTKLFGEVHPWVNWENMLEPCLIGVAVEHKEVTSHNPYEEMD